MSEEKKGFFKRLVSGLSKTRANIVSGFESIFSAFKSICFNTVSIYSFCIR